MQSIQKYRTIGRLVLFVLLGLSFVGPWFFDLIMVPAEYVCKPPFVRLDEVFCGSPMSFVAYVSSIVRSDISRLRSGMAGGLTLLEWTREFSFRFLFFLAALPLFSTLLKIWKPLHRSLQLFHWICLGLAAIIAFGSMAFSETLHSALWGIWLYRVLVLLALVWEALLASRHHSPVRPPMEIPA